MSFPEAATVSCPRLSLSVPAHTDLQFTLGMPSPEAVIVSCPHNPATTTYPRWHYSRIDLTEGSNVQQELSTWINIGARHYRDIDRLFTAHEAAAIDPQWGSGGISVLRLEVELRARKFQGFTAVLRVLDNLLADGVFPPNHETMEVVHSTYGLWNTLSEDTWSLLVQKFHNAAPPTPSHLLYSTPQNRPSSPFITKINLSTRNSCSALLANWEKRSHQFPDVEYLLHLRADNQNAKRHAVGRCLTIWRIALALRALVLRGRFPPTDEDSDEINRETKNWNTSCADVQNEIDTELAGPKPNSKECQTRGGKEGGGRISSNLVSVAEVARVEDLEDLAGKHPNM